MKTIILGIVTFCVVLILIVFEAIINAQIHVYLVKRNIEKMGVLRDLAKENPPDTKAIDTLIVFVHSRDPFERTAAIAYLGQVGSNAAPAVVDLIEALKGNDPYDAREAATSLGEIGSGARVAVPSLLKAVKDYPNADIGWFAAQSLGHIVTSNDIEVVELLRQSATSSDNRMSHSAVEALQALGVTNNTITN